MTDRSFTLLLAGATGLVGRQVLALALADPRIKRVVAPVRRPLPERPRLFAPIVDYDHLPADADWWLADAVICTLGTTIRAAGSQAAFRRVDLDYPSAVADLAHRAGTPTFALNSAAGADARSRVFYNRVKGELENALIDIGFLSLTFVRPGLIGGLRDEDRPAERRAQKVLTAVGPVLPRRWRINPAQRIAAKLIEAAVTGTPGIHVVKAEELA